MSRRVVRSDAGILRIEQRLGARTRAVGTDVSGPACVYAQIEVLRGAVWFLRGTGRVAAPGRCDLYLPPYSIVQAVLERCDVVTTAIAVRGRKDVPGDALLLPADTAGPPRSLDDIVARVQRASNVWLVGRAPEPPALAARGRALIDALYARPVEIGRVAARLRTSPAHFSRAFKTAFGLPPVRYRHHVRVMDALLQFAEGAVPADVFQNVGFDDLSRFYKVFRSVACAAPGTYRTVTSRNAKT